MCDQTRLVIANKTGDVTVTSAGNNGNLFGMQRSDAGGAVVTNPAAVNWANVADYATAAELPIFGNGSNTHAFRAYFFEFFYGSDTTAPLILGLNSRAAVDSTTIGPKLKWNAPAATTLQLLDPAGVNAGARATMSIAWTHNVVADAIHEVGVFTAAGGARVDQPSTRVAQGSDSSVTGECAKRRTDLQCESVPRTGRQRQYVAHVPAQPQGAQWRSEVPRSDVQLELTAARRSRCRRRRVVRLSSAMPAAWRCARTPDLRSAAQRCRPSRAVTRVASSNCRFAPESEIERDESSRPRARRRRWRRAVLTQA